MSKILIVEDHTDINDLLAEYLKREGYEVIQAFSGTEALLLMDPMPDLILLDLMLPGLTGEELMDRIQGRCSIPIIVISGKVHLEDRIYVLEKGADDFISKPFEKREVLARVRSVLRRSSKQMANAEILTYSKLVLDSKRHVTEWQGEPIKLTNTEFMILKVLISEPEQVFSRDRLYKLAWDESYVSDDNAITVHISRLRQKLKQVTGKDLISTVWGIGYRMVPLEEC